LEGNINVQGEDAQEWRNKNADETEIDAYGQGCVYI